MRFASLPSDERPRERLTKRGVESLSIQELLALQIRSGTHGSSATDLAQCLLADFGDLSQLRNASVDELSRVSGIGQAKAAAIVAGFELARRASQQDGHGPPVLTKASDVAAVAADYIGHCRRERVVVFVCNRRSCLLRGVVLAEGSDRRSVIEVREVLNAVLRHDGSVFAVAHNHPSGDPTPSRADIEVTARLLCASKVVGLRFLGHIVVGADSWAEVEARPGLRKLD